MWILKDANLTPITANARYLLVISLRRPKVLRFLKELVRFATFRASGDNNARSELVVR
jgi:hypothetical protein